MNGTSNISDQHRDRLRAAWAIFDRQEWSGAGATFDAILHDLPQDAIAARAEASFGLAHAHARQNNISAIRKPLDQALTIAAGNPNIRIALTQAWIPRSSRGLAINPAEIGIDGASVEQLAQTIELLRVLALIYESAGDLAGTLLVYYTLLSTGPADEATLVKLGFLWMSAQNNVKAARFFTKALAKNPNAISALGGLADIAWLEGDVEKVRELQDRRAKLFTDPAERAASLFKAAAVQPVIAFDDTQIDETRTRFADMLAAGPTTTFVDPWKLALGPNFYVNYQGRDDRALQESAAAYYLAATPNLGEVAPHVSRRRTGAKIRVGMASSFFTGHTIGYLNRGLILGLDRTRFDLVLFRTPGARFDDSTMEMGMSARMLDLPADLPSARRIISGMELDVLHYPEIGMDYFAYFLAFARLARLQTVGWGHPVTTGIPHVDLFLSVNAMEPPNGDTHYSEKLIQLQRLSIDVQPATLVGTPLGHAELGLTPNRPAYVCAQSLFKVHHTFDDTIRLIIERDRDARVYFISHGEIANQQFMTRLGRRLGSDIARVTILPRVTPQHFVHLLRAADVLLDVPQWAGGKTSLEGFAMGTPIVHQPGAYMRGRHTLAFYRRMGITAPVVDGPESYADTAARLVHDQAFRREIRQQIAERSPSLYGDTEAIREIETVWVDALTNTA